jgi:acyl-coenzyme A synthetase/AMP-(fatty) acid ligase
MKFTSITEAVSSWAKNTPDKNMLIDANTGAYCTYSDFLIYCNKLALQLKSRNVRKGDRVLVRVGGMIETFVSMFGIFFAGGVYCPVEKYAPKMLMAKMAKFYNSSVTISTENYNIDGEWIDLTSVLKVPSELVNTELSLPEPDDACAIVFTTGTTGKAKGVMHTYRSLISGVNALAGIYAGEQNDVFMWIQPLDRISCLFSACIPLIFGGTIVHHEGIIFINSFFSAIEKYNVTLLYTQPFAINILLKSGLNQLNKFNGKIRVWGIGGSFLSTAQAHDILEKLPATCFFISYASTEILGISYYFLNGGIKPNCVGKLFDSVDVKFVNDDGVRFIPYKNNFGILTISSSGNFQCYWDDDVLTKSCFSDGYVTTTDTGYLDGDGYLYLSGRRDDVIVSGGFKIAPYEIEEVVTQMPEILEAICIEMPDTILGSVPKLFVTMQKDNEFSEKQIYDFLSQRLERYKLPRAIQQLYKFPTVNASQKIDRKALKNYE